MRFGSVCSGIEAASVAWNPLGWEAAWLSEIEPFPCAVLSRHYPDVPNLGDMTTLPERILSGEVEAPDLFCGGTPCQAFSVAGLRNSLDDARGNLSLTFVGIANAIDHVRSTRSDHPAIVFWENVPGVLSTKDNAFGCFLGALAGEDDPLIPPGGKWTNAGCVYGPQRAVAWRVLDAQYFGVAQRRRRVFVVASARNDFDPASVLFEFGGVRRDTAPSRETWKDASRVSLQGLGYRCKCGHEFEESLGAYGCPNCEGEAGPATLIQPYSVGNTLTARMAKGINSTLDEGQTPVIVGSLSCNTGPKGHDAGNFACNQAVDAGHVLPVSYALQHAQIGRKYEAGPQGKGWQKEVAFTQDSRSCADAVAIVPAQPIAFHPTQDPISSEDGTTHGLGCGSGGGQASVAVAQPINIYGGNKRQDRPEGGFYVRTDEATSKTLDAATGLNPTCSQGGTAVMQAMQVRRLTPVECERLQGFPDTYTQIPWRKKPAEDCPDGPRYKALGNSWAVPNVHWIGKRIQEALNG